MEDLQGGTNNIRKKSYFSLKIFHSPLNTKKKSKRNHERFIVTGFKEHP